MDVREIGWEVWSGFAWLRIGILAGCCECGDEIWGSGATELVGEQSCMTYWKQQEEEENFPIC
jgi:hypothetical protein